MRGLSCPQKAAPRQLEVVCGGDGFQSVWPIGKKPREASVLDGNRSSRRGRARLLSAIRFARKIALDRFGGAAKGGQHRFNLAASFPVPDAATARHELQECFPFARSLERVTVPPGPCRERLANILLLANVTNS